MTSHGLAARLDAPGEHHYAIAEEVTVKGADAKASTKRPNVVIYVNGIALGVVEAERVALTTTDIVSCLAYR